MPLLTEPGGAIRSVFQITIMFMLVVIGWVIFRADSVEQLATILGRFSDPNWGISQFGIVARFVFVLPLVAMQAFQYRSNDLNVALTMKPVYQGGLYAALILGILMFGVTDASTFIYFQF